MKPDCKLHDPRRRQLMLAAPLGTLFLTAACTPMRQSATDSKPPIVFVHGNGDTAALWITTLWRFESNGWPRDRLHAIHLPYPLARSLDGTAQAGRTSTAEHRAFLAAEVDKVLAATGSTQVVLFANSRGGNAIRSYILNGGAAKVSHAILGGTPNHGVRVDAANGRDNEFNGASDFLTGLNNQGGPGIEITPGPRWLTLRSDNNDKFAQPEGTWIGAPGKATGVGHDGPELKGATNVVLPGVDHRETSFSPQAFAAAYQFITGHAPRHTDITPEPAVVLSGQVSGLGLNNNPATGAFVNNLPLAGATVEVFETDPATGLRLGPARLRQTLGADGRWGPLNARPQATYEFVVSAAGYATTHVYREPFPRSSNIVHLRAELLTAADAGAGSVLVFTRPRGYFGLPRDQIVFDGANPAPGLKPGVAGLSVSRIRVAASPERAVEASFNGRSIVARNWPAANNHLVLLELH